MLASTTPLNHSQSIRDGLAYLRLVTDTDAACAFLDAAAPHLARIQTYGPLSQVDFRLDVVDALLQVVVADYFPAATTMPECDFGHSPIGPSLLYAANYPVSPVAMPGARCQDA